LGKLIAAVVLAPIVILVVGIGGCEARKAYYDWQVRQMCETDGGVTVYERVTLTRDEYRRLGGLNGTIPVPEERSAEPNYPYVAQTRRTNIRDSDPWIWRSESVYRRRPDGRELARIVSYSRVGGDFPFTASHPSAFSCPEQAKLVTEERGVFSVEGELK
jgi:hypothetical protein